MLKLRFGVGFCRWTFGGALYQESRRNAGHSKWANIKHTKALKDGQKSAMFTKIGRMMRVAIIEGGSADPGSNAALARAVDYARRCNMPAASVASVLRGAAAAKEAARPATLDFRGPGNCVIVADVLTDNMAKTRQGLATVLRKNNGSYADGTSRHLFDVKGVVAATGGPPTLAEEHAIEAGAEDVAALQDPGSFRFVCAVESLTAVAARLAELGWTIVAADKEFVAHSLVTLNDEQLAAAATLCEKLEESPDIVRLYDNIA